MQEFGGVGPPAVEVDTQDVATVISVNNAVRVQHRHYLEYELFPQGLRLFASGLEEEVDDALDHEGGVRFTRMHTARHQDRLLVRVAFVDVFGNSQYIASVSLEGLT